MTRDCVRQMRRHVETERHSLQRQYERHAVTEQILIDVERKLRYEGRPSKFQGH